MLIVLCLAETYELVVSAAPGHAADLNGLSFLVSDFAKQDGLVDDAGVVVLEDCVGDFSNGQITTVAIT